MSQLGFNNDYEFIIDSEPLGSREIEEPLNWDEVEKVYARANIGFGTLAKQNTELELIGEGYLYIRQLLLLGFGNEATITKRAKSKTLPGEDWGIEYSGYLDIKKAEFDKSKLKPICKIGFTQGGLFDKIKARYNDKYDLVDIYDADGNEIGELETVTEQVQGREIFRESVATVETGLLVQHRAKSDDRNTAKAIPFWWKPNSDNGFIKDIYDGASDIGYASNDFVSVRAESLLFTKDERVRTRTINGIIKVDITGDEPGTLYLYANKYKYNPSSLLYDFEGKKELLASINVQVGNVLQYELNDFKVQLDPDEGFTFVMYSHTEDDIIYRYLENKITVVEDDNFQQTTAKVLLPNEILNRLLYKITGENSLLISNIFGRKDLGHKEDGEWAYLGVSSGFWARGYDDGDPVPDPRNEGEFYPKKQFTISLKECFESFQVPNPLMWGITKVRGKEYFRMEDYGFTQQDFIGVQLGRELNGKIQHIAASNVVEIPMSEYLFTSAEIGYNEGGSGFEEISGLSTPFGVGSFNTSLKFGDPNAYIKRSKIRADLEGFDLARRKPASLYYDTDTPYDQKLFFRHLKKVGGQFFLRTWQDDFESEPRNIYSPSTTGNLLLTPFRCAIRHGRILATSVIGMPNERFVAISSEANNNKLITKRPNEIEIDESGSILNSQLGSPYNSGVLLKFDGKVYPSMVKQIEGSTKINDESTPNWYGIYEIVENGQIRYGRLTNVDISGDGSHEAALLP